MWTSSSPTIIINIIIEGLNLKFEAIKIISKWQWIFFRGDEQEWKSADKLWWRRNWINYSDMLHHQTSSKWNRADHIIKSLNGNSWNSSLGDGKIDFSKICYYWFYPFFSLLQFLSFKISPEMENVLKLYALLFQVQRAALSGSLTSSFSTC